jgi:molybdopterin-guanine dinucleotide biosynthesis protein A
MSSGGHKKHAEVIRPTYGSFAITGGRCDDIKALASRLIEALPQYRCGYADAHHAKPGDTVFLPGRLQEGAAVEYSFEGPYHQLNFTGSFNDFQKRAAFQSCDLVFINGNHFEASAQILILDPLKKESLKKRLSQLHSIQLILRTDPSMEPFDFLQPILPANVPIYNLSDTENIVDFFRQQMQSRLPKLQGLVLAGGKSIRLGRDKSKLVWHQKEQRYHLADLLQEFCASVHISCRPEQAGEINEPYQPLPDTFLNLGPYGAILSAFRSAPDSAWLVLACDLPLLNRESLQHLTSHRNASSSATAFESPRDGSPEPLVAIWEPKSYPLLLNLLSQGITCPRKALLSTFTHLIPSLNPHFLLNVNSPSDEALARGLINQE